MNVENRDYHSHLNNLHDECQKHMYYHVILTMTDGSTVDGIIERVDSDSISLLTGEDVMEQDNGEEMDTRQFYGGYGYPRRFRRFRPRVFPLAALTALALLPYIAPYPYYPYPYSYY